MANVIITKEREFSWDITAYNTDNGHIIHKAWAMNRDQAIGKAELMAEYYRDDNGQISGIILNEK